MSDLLRWWLLLRVVCSDVDTGEPLQERRLRGPNCTQTTCNNAENLCGEFTQGCHIVGRVSNGPEIWLSTFFEFRSGGTDYRRVERGAVSQAQCLSGDYWLKLEYSGKWGLGGGSPYVNGFSLATLEVQSAWITLLKAEACLDKVNGVQTCYDTLAALKALCPCNGWDWQNSGAARERNIGMFCQPLSQCSLINSVYLEQTQYFSYNATVGSVCFSKANTLEDAGWMQPTDDACIRKSRDTTCPRGALSAAAPTHLGLIAFLMLVVQVSSQLLRM